MLWLMVVICLATQLFVEARTLRSKISAIRNQSEQELCTSSLVVDMFTTRTGNPLRMVSCADHRTELSSFLGVSS